MIDGGGLSLDRRVQNGSESLRSLSVMQFCLQFWLAESLPSSTISAIQRWKGRFLASANMQNNKLCRKRKSRARLLSLFAMMLFNPYRAFRHRQGGLEAMIGR